MQTALYHGPRNIRIVVIGAGAIGSFVLAGLRHLGNYEIAVVDNRIQPPNDDRHFLRPADATTGQSTPPLPAALNADDRAR
jgi:tRNA A37 threonylcarbamoyladenosine dehydratase